MVLVGLLTRLCWCACLIQSMLSMYCCFTESDSPTSDTTTSSSLSSLSSSAAPAAVYKRIQSANGLNSNVQCSGAVGGRHEGTRTARTFSSYYPPKALLWTEPTQPGTKLSGKKKAVLKKNWKKW